MPSLRAFCEPHPDEQRQGPPGRRRSPARERTIVDTTVPGCGSGTAACIDPIFGPTAFGTDGIDGLPGLYWSATIAAANDGVVLTVDFADGSLDTDTPRFNTAAVARAVRGGR